jgi:hypothetical protein
VKSGESANPRLVGISVDGPPPLGRIDLKFSPAVHVLYGLNGAGKTALLNAIRSAFMGLVGGRPSVALHLHVDSEGPDTTGEGSPAFETLSYALLTYYNEYLTLELRQRSIDPRLPLPANLGTPHVRRTALGRLLLMKIGSPHDERWDPMYEEIADQGMFSLIPCGRGRPRWAIWISARLDDTAPTLLEAWNLTCQVRESGDEVFGSEVAAYPRWLPAPKPVIVSGGCPAMGASSISRMWRLNIRENSSTTGWRRVRVSG